MTNKKEKGFKTRLKPHVVEVSKGKWIKILTPCVETAVANLSLIGKQNKLITIYSN